MESNSRFAQLLTGWGERIAEQTWFQQLKSKWEELDPQSRNHLRKAGFAGGALLGLLILLNAVWSVRSLKQELADKAELLSLIQTSSEEVRHLRESGMGHTDGDGGPWAPYLESVAQNAGIEKSAVSVSDEKAPPSAAPAKGGKGFVEEEGLKEALVDVTLKQINIKQVVRFAVALEQGLRPVKVRNLTIDTQPDLSGHVSATLALSAFRAASKNP